MLENKIGKVHNLGDEGSPGDGLVGPAGAARYSKASKLNHSVGICLTHSTRREQNFENDQSCLF